MIFLGNLFLSAEAVTRRWSVKKVFLKVLKISLNLLERIIYKTPLRDCFSKCICKRFSLEDFSFLKNRYITISIEQQHVRQMQYLNSQMYTQKDKNMNMTLGIAVGSSLLFLMLAIIIGIVAYLKKLKERSVF